MTPTVGSFLLERAFRALQLPKELLVQLKHALNSADVGGDGFPSELMQLSLPMVARGLLNYSVLQMQRNWVYPFWVHRQLDPSGSGFVPRSQNPLMINITNRSWTGIGSTNGFHEGVVDPRGLLTPLPREWSVDLWVKEGGETFFPSLQGIPDQKFDNTAPMLSTSFLWRELQLSTEAFVDTIRGGKDVMFCRATVRNELPIVRTVQLMVSLRPFGPEGVAPIKSIELESKRILSVDACPGIVFERAPDGVLFGNQVRGDVANIVRSTESLNDLSNQMKGEGSGIVCKHGLANASAVFAITLPPHERYSVAFSMALSTKEELRSEQVKTTWRVSFEKRRRTQKDSWQRELEGGATFLLDDGGLQSLFDTSRAILLQLQDKEFISPGPYLYHKFWFRDAAPMVRALDVLGFSNRTRQVVDAFQSRLMPDGFFRGPGGEWDSNGAVLWVIAEHYRVTRSRPWLRNWYPFLRRGAEWIVRMRHQTTDKADEHRGLMPRSLSAEHLGTVDQYYWDSFWSLAGLEAMTMICRELGQVSDLRRYQAEVRVFRKDLLHSFDRVEARLGRGVIPSAPSRSFDESAIGSVACVYPLDLFPPSIPHPANTVRAIKSHFIDHRGFYHPIIHSGYNPYLTLQVAQALVQIGEIDDGWTIAESMFQQASATGSFPEAIHPGTGGGAMGDGQHGWAAAEVVLFLRNAILKERDGRLLVLSGNAPHVLRKRGTLKIAHAPTSFGKVSIALEHDSPSLCHFQFSPEFLDGISPDSVEIRVPWIITKASPSSHRHLLAIENDNTGATVRMAPHASNVVLKLQR